MAARRRSVFKEVGLTAGGDELGDRLADRKGNELIEDTDAVNQESKSQVSGAFLPQSESASSTETRSMMYRFGTALLFIGALISLLQSVGIVGHDAAMPLQGVDGGTIPEAAKRDITLERRETSRTSWCFKWAQQCTWKLDISQINILTVK